MTPRAEKQHQQLAALEAEFHRDLVVHLRTCASGRDTLLFLVSSLRPRSWPQSVRSTVADDLFATASDIMSRRARLGLDATASLAARYHDACTRHVNLDDHQRPGPRQQAQQLLVGIGEAG